MIKGSTATGQIIEIKDKNAIINFNGITIKSKLSELEIVKENVRDDNRGYDAPRMFDNDEYNPELDLRGKYTEDIKDMIDVFLNNANINSIKVVRIIHGKGTGKLRVAVNQHLKNHKLVKSYRLGNWNEGDSGVTIVEL
jgi:DNA mismatch repair protein MutS2